MLSAFSLSKLQDFNALLSVCGGLSLAEAKKEVKAAIASRIQPGGQKNTRKNRLPSPYRVCPACGGGLTPVVNADNLNILGCKRCRYSRIFNEL